MLVTVIVIFVAGYIAIAFEHSTKIDKAASALLTGVLCWLLFVFNAEEKESAVEFLMHHLSEISSILFFLLGAMTIVELIDAHNGFSVITNKIVTNSKVKLLWIVGIITFILSSLLDNLTTAIVMTSLIAKILPEKTDRLWFVSIIIISANAGGAFSPMGDVTTTMLWIGGQITAMGIIKVLILPSIAVALIPLLIVSRKFLNQSFRRVENSKNISNESTLILIVGIILLIMVPVFKIATHLPPFMGMILSLSIFWIFVSVIHKNKSYEERKKFSPSHALQKIDTPSILFFLGILLAVSALESFGILKELATVMDNTLGNVYLTGTALGIISAIVDNVPLVAAAQGMYDLNTYPTDHRFWEFLALSTGTGGSMIIIGSAAGVAAMGIEKIEFIWYLKKITLIAFLGFVAGISVFILQSFLI
jgi:Na+/H+ antiporter NhaD/arsenite permease-like protein